MQLSNATVSCIPCVLRMYIRISLAQTNEELNIYIYIRERERGIINDIAMHCTAMSSLHLSSFYNSNKR